MRRKDRRSAKGGATGKEADASPLRKNRAPGVKIDDELDLRDIGDQLPVLRERIERFKRHVSARERLEQMVDGMLRYGPYAMFALLPAFAVLLKMLYLGRRRRYPHRPRLYGEHLVFAAHNHAFLFVDAVAAIAVPATLAARGACRLGVRLPALVDARGLRRLVARHRGARVRDVDRLYRSCSGW